VPEVVDRAVVERGLIERLYALMPPRLEFIAARLPPAGGLLPGVLLVSADSMGSVLSSALKAFASPGVSAEAPYNTNQQNMNMHNVCPTISALNCIRCQRQ
jgi:hypothetical protein